VNVSSGTGSSGLSRTKSVRAVKWLCVCVRITATGNSLPNWVVDVDNINTFKARLDKVGQTRRFCMILQRMLLEPEIDHSATQMILRSCISKVCNLDMDIETYKCLCPSSAL